MWIIYNNNGMPIGTLSDWAVDNTNIVDLLSNGFHVWPAPSFDPILVKTFQEDK